MGKDHGNELLVHSPWHINQVVSGTGNVKGGLLPLEIQMLNLEGRSCVE